MDVPKPAVSDGRVLVKITAAGVTPLDHTILSGAHPRAKAPLVFGRRGSGSGGGVREGGRRFLSASRVMLLPGYTALQRMGPYSEWLAVRKENLCLIPDNIEDVSPAAGIPVAYLTRSNDAEPRRICEGQGRCCRPRLEGRSETQSLRLARAQGAKPRHLNNDQSCQGATEEARSLGFDKR